MRAHIIGTGSYVPEKVLTNRDLEKIVETTDEWIVERTGIRERHVAAPGENTSDMDVKAAIRALEMASTRADELDLIIVGTVTPDMPMPACAAFVAHKLGATKAFAFDLSAACAGSLFGLSVASQFIETGTARTVLVIGAEKLSGIINWKDRNTCVLFGDGAGAAIMQRAQGGKGVVSRFMRSDGHLASLLYRPKGGSAEPVTPEILAEGSHLVAMAGRETFKHAVRSMNEALDRALADAGLTGDDIDLLIPHQANLRIIEATAKHGHMPMDKVFVNVDRYGNTSAGSVPIALDEAMQSGRIQPGMKVMLVAFGAGFTWASAIHQF